MERAFSMAVDEILPLGPGTLPTHYGQKAPGTPVNGCRRGTAQARLTERLRAVARDETGSHGVAINSREKPPGK